MLVVITRPPALRPIPGSKALLPVSLDWQYHRLLEQVLRSFQVREEEREEELLCQPPL